MDVGGGHALLDNLFNGDRVLRKCQVTDNKYYFLIIMLFSVGMVNDVVNRSFDVFLKELMPVIEKALSKVFMDTANAIVESFTYKQLFPH